ncbi:MAG: hypothetical protein BGN88_11205 [Clostridiales bacterium 43-6]|nr:MAG: hypothetical protein BGN88_11205 [Clostridiales bacterium 43-6]
MEDLHREVYLKTMEDARKTFLGYKGNHSMMGRDNPYIGEEYYKFHITRETEIEWITEHVETLYNDFMNGKINNDLWIWYSTMEEFISILKTEDALLKLLEVTKYIKEKVPVDERVIVAETINGRNIRKCKSGLIYLSHRLNNRKATSEFIELALYYASFNQTKRERDAKRLTKKIKLEVFYGLRI